MSIILNIVLLGTLLIYIYSTGGIRDWHEKPQVRKAVATDYRQSHKDKKVMQQASVFELLPDTEDEIIFLGDSFTSSGRWSESFQNSHIKNRGIPGDRTDLMINRLSEIGMRKPQKIFIMVGYNDLNHGRTVQDTMADYRDIIKTLTRMTPGTEIYIQSVLPINIRIRNLKQGSSRPISNSDILALNALLESLSREYNLTYIDLYSAMVDDNNQLNSRYTDTGFHLNGQGYEAWLATIDSYINE